MKQAVRLLLFLAVSLGLCAAQIVPAAAPSRFGGTFYAAQYSQGDRNFTVAGNSAAGAATITLQYGSIILADGREIAPYATNASIIVGTGATRETVTPTAVSSCYKGRQSANYQICQITATFAQIHGAGEQVLSGTFGLQEAINDASQNNGYVQADGLWASYGGTTALLQAASFALVSPAEPNATYVQDTRPGSMGYWYGSPGLTLITTPTALTTASTLTTSITGGSIATATTPRFTITAVDQFGGETAAAADAAGTATLVDGAGSTNSYTITAAGVPTGTGIVGYRVYVSASGGATQTETLEPAANLVCAAAPLSPLPGTCGAGASILITALPATTAAGPPQGTSGAATSLSAAHTTIVTKQSGIAPTMLPFNDSAAPGYFPVTVTSATTLAAGFDVFGELPYPAGYFNTLGSSYRVCGGGVVTASAATVAGTWTIRIGPRQNSAGTSGAQVAVPFGLVASNLFTAALTHFDFCTDITVSTTGTSGIVEGSGSMLCTSPAAGVAPALSGCEAAFNAASSAVDLTQQGVLQVTYVQSAASWTTPQLRYLTIRRI